MLFEFGDGLAQARLLLWYLFIKIIDLEQYLISIILLMRTVHEFVGTYRGTGFLMDARCDIDVVDVSWKL
jgi:hypothetical protein